MSRGAVNAPSASPARKPTNSPALYNDWGFNSINSLRLMAADAGSKGAALG